VERLAALLNLLAIGVRYFFLFLLYRFLWQLLKVTGQGLASEPNSLTIVVTDLSNPTNTKRYNLESQLLVGRGHENQICLNDPYCAGTHLRLWREGDKVFAEDLETTFGTLISGTPLPKGVSVEIKPGTKIMIGTTQISLQPQQERSVD
jgi:pSer/pThr/pTyr-binding forkhead associated (FHA) protein